LRLGVENGLKLPDILLKSLLVGFEEGSDEGVVEGLGVVEVVVVEG
jgi:hypothetical protein